MRRSAWFGGGVACGACAIALVRVVTAPTAVEPMHADEAARRGAFFAIASEENKMRRDAEKKFPTDPWSQDDDFHNSERTRVKAIAAERGMSVTETWWAIDEGIRSGWPHELSSFVRVTVPPCQPRAIY